MIGEQKGVPQKTAEASWRETFYRPNIQRLQSYMERHKSTYQTITLPQQEEPLQNIQIHIPTSELEGDNEPVNKEWYVKTVQDAVETSQTIFKTHLPQMNFLFVSTTEEWNDYYKDEKGAKKVRGDRLKGIVNYPNVMCMTPSSLPTETNYPTNHKVGETPAMYVKSVVDHEVAHNAIEYKYGHQIAHSLPGWVGEGIPMVINHSPVRNAFSEEYKKRLSLFLQKYPDAPPSNKALAEAQKESGAPFTYNYGQEFLTWLTCLGPEETPELELKSNLDTFIQNGIIGNGFDVDTAMRKTFFMSYKEAYVQFRSHLMQGGS